MTKYTIPTITTITGGIPYHDILREFPEITRPDGTRKMVCHRTKHYVVTTPGASVTLKPKRLVPDKLKIKLVRIGASIE